MRLTLVLLACLLSLNVSAQKQKQKHKKIEMTEGSWSEILAMAKETGKPIFVDVHAVWCKPCLMMERSVFTQKSVAKFYNEEFINYKLDVDTREGQAIANEYNVQSIPHFLFFNSDGKMVYDADQVMPPAQFLRAGQRGLKKSK